MSVQYCRAFDTEMENLARTKDLQEATGEE